MFDFEKLEIYKVINTLNIKVLKHLLANKELDIYLKDQWKRATLSILLNLAEGTGRMSSADKKRFFTIARSSVFECVAILNLVKDIGSVAHPQYEEFYLGYEQISKMLLGMYRSS